MKKAMVVPCDSTCSFCQYIKAQDALPDFGSDEVEDAFWDRHSPRQFPNLFKRTMSLTQMGGPVRPIPRERRVKVTLMMRPSLKSSLERLAEKKGIGYQTLAQEILSERVRQLETKQR